MFTGLIEAVGVVAHLAPHDGGARLSVACPFASELAPGESVAVNGCCLTHLAGDPGSFHADLSPETLARTTLGELRAGDRVNLERALRLSDRLGGHLVQGHVDGVETVLEISDEGGWRRERISLAAADAPFVIPKGSIAIDGISLTVAALGPGWLEVALIPHTLAATCLGEHAAGRRVNVEHDMAGKYLLRAEGLAGRVLPAGTRARLGL